MKRLMPTLVLLLVAACADTPHKPDARSLDWLAGCWRMERNDVVYEEMWLPLGADGTVGAAREVRGGRTVSYEFQRIELRADGSAAFVAQPLHQEAATFPMVAFDAGRIIFANPRHDFPTRIEYRVVGVNEMHARISGTVKGQARAVEYPMERMDCES